MIVFNDKPSDSVALLWNDQECLGPLVPWSQGAYDQPQLCRRKIKAQKNLFDEQRLQSIMTLSN
jgi:hypothetical protein